MVFVSPISVGAQFIAPKDGSGRVHVTIRHVLGTFASPPPSLGAMNCAPTDVSIFRCYPIATTCDSAGVNCVAADRVVGPATRADQ